MDSLLSFLTNINVVFYLVGYVVGGMPFGYWLVRAVYKVDVTAHGSGGIGATNVVRVLKNIDPSKAKRMGALVLVLDLVKGVFCVLLAKLAGLNYAAQWMVAITTILGHCYSPFLNFKGGKGVSTTMGAVLLLIPVESLIGLALWAAIGKGLKISSLASIVGVGTATILIFFMPKFLPAPINIVHEVGTQTPMVLIFIFTLYKHWGNVLSLLGGKEGKIL
ncbi:glycerol-3-phosphate 1-O-acyltransferase PlsY [Helicobacter ailurogastricus]|uniref:glycerol-3-phosphate 1-O-acyltransferase PlsY n=1 Tax=Helicobacter ailurogastricus TaxID=1578720 RepID=UPI0022C42C2C|nr:glycerol-3-phosphate 1-O-acyltransferase PlsY [Helicobacter ailurogastricus]GLH58101.1 Putative glycerol-3-phosphate acyltransferase PlsY [Helicobacter ailurogastricus]GLH58926.1 Putative glycerol-3-phosphate acyltransferase PlsY [Helicobacter ailurogastricus]